MQGCQTPWFGCDDDLHTSSPVILIEKTDINVYKLKKKIQYIKYTQFYCKSYTFLQSHDNFVFFHNGYEEICVLRITCTNTFSHNINRGNESNSIHATLNLLSV